MIPRPLPCGWRRFVQDSALFSYIFTFLCVNNT